MSYATDDAEMSSAREIWPVHLPFLLDPLMGDKPCPRCGSGMELVASIGNNCFSRDEGFFGNDFVQLVFLGCAKCHVLSAINVTS